MHIGLVGGIGPAATVVYYRELVRFYAAAGLALPLTIANAEVRVMTDNLVAGRAVEQAEIFARLIDRLRDGGCEVAALTSMGGHFCIDELRMRSSLPLVSAVDVLERYFASCPYARVGVLGTRAVMSSGLYGLKAVEVVAPDGDDLARINDAYLAMAMAGAASADHRALFRSVAMRLVRDQKVDAIVLGGTDLSIAFDGSDADYPVIDSAVVHARGIAGAAQSLNMSASSARLNS